MSLNKVTYVDGTTVIGATNLNAIQDEIIQNAEAINGKADSSTTYTKSEVNSLISNLQTVSLDVTDEDGNTGTLTILGTLVWD